MASLLPEVEASMPPPSPRHPFSRYSLYMGWALVSALCPPEATRLGYTTSRQGKHLSRGLPCDGDMRCTADERQDNSSARDHDSTAGTCAASDYSTSLFMHLSRTQDSQGRSRLQSSRLGLASALRTLLLLSRESPEKVSSRVCET